MKKMIALFMLLVGPTMAFGAQCTLPEMAAKAMAELYVLKNEAQIRDWVGEAEDISTLANRIAQTAAYSEERNSYYFEVITYPNNGGRMHSAAWLEAHCSGVEFDFQLID